ncbi:hypothetical protein T440DRAFT_489678 [Plenodomus tracheiphilus IPT5]|uniref:Uncharacterized protein n=1 Tax=Plenodomus tracheiphilus IPT5 TaxID=1408161 RepID=A0A6A7B7U7_9PLEO|nr:hypothetical protein T440DRAFT_489678 [Plenodomus tracheiphilus IPT5]
MSGSACFRSIAQSAQAGGLFLAPLRAPLLTGRPNGQRPMQRSREPEQTLVICSLHGLFWAADRDETSTAQQAGRGPAVSTRRPPIHARLASGPWPRGQQSASSGARNATLSVDHHPFADDHPSLTSRRYRLPWFGKGSLLQPANATVVLENGHAKQPDQLPSPLYPVSSNSVSPLATVLLLPTLCATLPPSYLLGPDCGSFTLPSVNSRQYRQQRPATSQHPRRRSHDRKSVDATSLFSGELQTNPRSDNSAHHTAYIAARSKDRPGHFPYLSVLEIRDLWRQREEAKRIHRPPRISTDGLAATSNSQRQLIEDPAPVPAKRPDCLEANQQPL